MGFTKELATEKARNDLAARLNVDPGSVKEVSLTDKPRNGCDSNDQRVTASVVPPSQRM
jgi:hypothetical protein